MRSKSVVISGLFAVVAAVSFSSTSGCGGGNGGSHFGDDGGSSGGSGGSGSSSGLFGTPTSNCGTQCNVSCPANTTTTISGKVYDPALKNGIYDVVVYVPGGPLQPLPAGVPTGADKCDCSALFKSGAVASTTSLVDGTFKLLNAPVGTSVPLVFQIGKWRHYVPPRDAQGHRRQPERQHARHRRLDRQRRHARVPDEAHRPALR